ncbi:MAG: FIG00803302: hypothetical protein [uncultured Sphingomonadaceae bacterium]|uniref:HD domain-containing protein n=1 Tax=uncultured Sphingomonadaceae bacterium TaxID=169976 RepID=A0A6J4S8Y7_9SPHN|nr:MAG: FIG00803302: hypothetical protein [uncultured Sphingomonadaceae bacterium]
MLRPEPAEAKLTPAHLDLFRELCDLKRVHSADRNGSIAARLFAAGWSALLGPDDPRHAMLRTVAAAMTAARLGDLDLAKLTSLGLDRREAVAILERAFDEVAGPVDPALAADLRAALPQGAPAAEALPHFVTQLEQQPRAGVTSPGRARLMLVPAESHAEHSLAVAVAAALAAPAYGGDSAAAFVAGMAHHLHNAAMPDSGYTGEMMLGDKLAQVTNAAREQALGMLPPALAATMRAAQAQIADDATPTARAFHAADVIDRVIEIEQHLKAARTSMDDVLHTYGLVHDGPVKTFHDGVLRDVGLL